MFNTAFLEGQPDQVAISFTETGEELLNKLTVEIEAKPNASTLRLWGISGTYEQQTRESICNSIENLPPSITKVIVSRCHWEKSDLIDIVGAIIGRDTVHITSCGLSDSDQWRNILTALSQNNPKLTCLHIHRNQFEYKESTFNLLCEVLTNISPHLHELSITIPEQLNQTTTRAIQALCNNHPSLQTLNIPGLTEAQQQHLMTGITKPGFVIPVQQPAFNPIAMRQRNQSGANYFPRFLGAATRYHPYPQNGLRTDAHLPGSEPDQSNCSSSDQRASIRRFR